MVTGRDIEYRVDGLTMSGRLALSDGTGPRPAVLIAHEGNGLDEFQRTDLKAVVGFHPGLAASRPQDSANISGAVLVCIGSEDPIIPAERRVAFERDMRAAGVDWRMNLYGRAAHSFTHPGAGDPERHTLPGIEYHRASDERSWRAMLDLFDEVFTERPEVPGS
jgi:dienelactone hydrolase